MKILFFCTNWGSELLPFEKFIFNAKEAGYDGIEMSLPLNDQKLKDKIIYSIQYAGLLFIGQHWETVTTDFDLHKKEYLNRLKNLIDGNPVFINSQTGRDIFNYRQNLELIKIALRFSIESGIPIFHETHRGKFSFAAHITKVFLEKNPQLRISADFSHWCNVAESLLDDQQEAINLAISRADHIHARVGFSQGSQIPDPRAPEWDNELNRHLGWWDKILKRAYNEKKNIFTITPEFGPFPYMTILPHSKQPISDQWEINSFMMKLLKERYDEKYQGL
jgi:hypothetical protein